MNSIEKACLFVAFLLAGSVYQGQRGVDIYLGSQMARFTWPVPNKKYVSWSNISFTIWKQQI